MEAPEAEYGIFTLQPVPKEGLTLKFSTKQLLRVSLVCEGKKPGKKTDMGLFSSNIAGYEDLQGSLQF